MKGWGWDVRRSRDRGKWGKCLTRWFMTVGERGDDDDEGKRQTKLQRGRRRERKRHLVPQQGHEKEQRQWVKIKHCLTPLLQCLQKGAHRRDEQRKIHFPPYITESLILNLLFPVLHCSYCIWCLHWKKYLYPRLHVFCGCSIISNGNLLDVLCI